MSLDNTSSLSPTPTAKDLKRSSTSSHPMDSIDEQKLANKEVSRYPAAEIESVNDKKSKKRKEKQPTVPMHKLFRFATKTELLMICIAAIFSVGIGAIQPVSIIIFGDFMGTIGQHMITGDMEQLAKDSHPLILIFVYMGTAVLIASYIANCFWVLTGENQVRRIRRLYVHAILRQEMGWFDKAEEGSLTTRLAADTQLIQDGISEKFGLLIQCAGQFVAGFIVAFIKGWRLAGNYLY